jgi:hypothetical protein
MQLPAKLPQINDLLRLLAMFNTLDRLSQYPASKPCAVHPLPKVLKRPESLPWDRKLDPPVLALAELLP